MKVFLFIGYIPKNTVLYESLKSFGYELVFKPTIKNSSSQREKYKGNIDAELVLHTMIEFDNYDTAIIISSDGDFYCLVDYLLQKSKLKKIITTNPKYSSLLRKFASYIEPVRNMKQSIQKK